MLLLALAVSQSLDLGLLGSFAGGAKTLVGCVGVLGRFLTSLVCHLVGTLAVIVGDELGVD